MRIKSITVEQLFGGDKPYHLDFSSPEGVTILHAQNGMGKTTILSMIPSILQVDFGFLDSTPFKRATITLDDETEIIVDKKNVFDSVLEYDEEQDYSYEDVKLDPSLSRERRRKNEIKFTIVRQDDKKISSPLFPDIRERNPFGKMIPDDFMIARSGRIHLNNNHFRNKEFLEEYLSLISKIPVNFIKADRLYINSSDSRRMSVRRYSSAHESDREVDMKVEAISECAWDLRDRINNNKRTKEEVSEALDRTFPQRVIELYKNPQKNDEGRIRQQLQDLEQKRKDLERIGLIGDDKEALSFSATEEFPSDALPVLEIYINDTKEKLAAYDKLKVQMDLFLKAINESNAFANKKLVIQTNTSRSVNPYVAMKNAPKAIKFVTNDGREIPLERLSSGEKHAVILFYNLIFNSREDSLVMIDEPEISLHISWQQHFISSLLEICKENRLYAVIATHSPDIVNNHWDLLVNLDGTPVDDDDYEEE